MKLYSLRADNFRTYESLEIEFPSRLTFITGRNAAGKTNIVEAITVLSTGKSFRGSADQDLILHNKNSYYLRALYERQQQKYELEIGIEKTETSSRKKYRLNKKLIPGRQALIGNIVSVVFSPGDLQIAEGGSQHRRKFLDMVLSYQDPEYLDSLISYMRALKQRNAILKNVKEKKGRIQEIAIWDQGVVNAAKKITERRNQFIKEFEIIFEDSLQRISNQFDHLNIRLEMPPEEQDGLAESLKKNIYKDIKVGFTTTGPHRHSIRFEKNGRDMIQFASQGQKRTLVLALRIAQFYYLKQFTGIPPLLLIDDVIRELDRKRRSAFVNILHECGQAIFTTPDMDDFKDFLFEMKKEICVYEVTEPGRVNPVSL